MSKLQSYFTSPRGEHLFPLFFFFLSFLALRCASVTSVCVELQRYGFHLQDLFTAQTMLVGAHECKQYCMLEAETT